MGVQLKPGPPGAWLVGLGVICALASHGLFGAFLVDTAMGMCLTWAALVGLALSSRWGRSALAAAPDLRIPGAFFVLTLLAGLWSLTPWTPGGPHPVWLYVGSRGGASIDPSSTIIELIKLLGFGCAFLFGVLAGASYDRAKQALNLLIFLGAAAAAAAFAAFVTGALVQSQIGRFEALFLNPNAAGTVFGAMLLLALAAVIRAIRSKRPAGPRDGPLARAGAPAAAACIFLVCLLATASRGALLATFAGLILQIGWDILSSRSTKTWRILGAVVAVVLLVVVVAILGDRVLDRFLAFGEDAGIRKVIVAEHWKAFLASPLNGYGLGSFDPLNHSLLNMQNFDHLWAVRATHNVYVQWLEEGGLLGAIPMFATIASVIAFTVVRLTRRSRMVEWLHALVAIDLLVLVHGMSDFALQVPSVGAFWALLLGLQFSLAAGSSARSS